MEIKILCYNASSAIFLDSCLLSFHFEKRQPNNKTSSLCLRWECCSICIMLLTHSLPTYILWDYSDNFNDYKMHRILSYGTLFRTTSMQDLTLNDVHSICPCLFIALRCFVFQNQCIRSLRHSHYLHILFNYDQSRARKQRNKTGKCMSKVFLDWRSSIPTTCFSFFPSINIWSVLSAIKRIKTFLVKRKQH